MSHDLKTLITNFGLACYRDGPSAARSGIEGKLLDAALAALEPADLDTRAERAAKTLERDRCRQYEWSEDEFEIWWNSDDRGERANRIAEARCILLSAGAAGPAQEPAAYQVRRADGSPLTVWEGCTRDLYEDTLATGRYSGFESGPPSEVRRLFAGPVEWPAPLSDARILEIRDQIAVLVSEESSDYDALWIRAVRAAIVEAHAGMTLNADAAFDHWYAGQSHQLVNEPVCRLIWTRAWERCLTALRAGAPKIDARLLEGEDDRNIAVHGKSGSSQGGRWETLPRPAPELLECLQRFADVCADATADGHTERKDDMRALAEIGAVRPGPFGRTYMTDYGRWLLTPASPDQDAGLLPGGASWRDLLEAVLREIEDGEYLGPWTGAENAPGHGHDVPGIWDSHNGAKSGTACAWCMTWNKARKALAGGQRPLVVPVDRRVDSMSILIKQLVHSLRRNAPENPLADRALDYLRRHDLLGSPLRQDGDTELCAAAAHGETNGT